MPLSVPPNAVGLRLCRISNDRLIACEGVHFDDGAAGIDLVLRRAQISGLVEINGEIKNHFADFLLEDGS